MSQLVKIKDTGKLGADIVYMSTIFEVPAAVRSEVRMAGIRLVVNSAGSNGTIHDQVTKKSYIAALEFWPEAEGLISMCDLDFFSVAG